MWLLLAEPTYNRTRRAALAWRARILSQKALPTVSPFSSTRGGRLARPKNGPEGLLEGASSLSGSRWPNVASICATEAPISEAKSSAAQHIARFRIATDYRSVQKAGSFSSDFAAAMSAWS